MIIKSRIRLSCLVNLKSYRRSCFYRNTRQLILFNLTPLKQLRTQFMRHHSRITNKSTNISRIQAKHPISHRNYCCLPDLVTATYCLATYSIYY